MAAIPSRPILPITPTQDEHGDPTVCRVCSMRAFGLGIGDGTSRPQDAGWLCIECAALIETVRDMRRWDPYELRALDGCVEALAAACEERGTYNLLDMDELDVRMISKRIVMAFGDTLRRLLREESPF